MKDIVVLITCCGGMISPSQIYCLKSITERKVTVIGVDMEEYAIGAYLVDRFYRVPSGNDQKYVPTILQICREEKVDVILPCSHEEAMALTKEQDKFDPLGVKIAVSRYKYLELAFDKGTMYEHLQRSKLLCPEYFIVRSAEEFKAKASKLGYPRKPIVMKPRISRGGRGARILTDKSLMHYLLEEKPGSLYDNLEKILSALAAEKQFPELILMEYLPGEYYSVDLLAQGGKALITVPKVRIQGNPSQTLVGAVKKNAEAETLAADICEAFQLDYNVNIEMKRSTAGQLLPYDLNPRPAASVAFCAAAGANLLYFSVKLALEEELPAVKIKDEIIMIRSLRELFVTPDKKFFMDEVAACR